MTLRIIFADKIDDNIMHIDKGLLQRFIVIQEKPACMYKKLQSLVKKVLSKSISVLRNVKFDDKTV